MTSCSCGGRLYVREGSAWRPCSCLEASRGVRAWREAGIPTRHDQETWRTFLERFRVSRGLLEAARDLREGRQVEVAVVGDDEGRALAETLLLRAGIEGGLAAERLDLARLVDREFKRDEDGSPDPYSRPLVSLRLGGEQRHAWNAFVLEKLLRVRRDASLSTVLVGREPSASALSAGSQEGERAVLERFRRTEVVKR